MAHANWLLLMANCAAYLTTLIELHTAFEVMLLQGNEDYRSQQRSFESWDTIDQCDDCIRLYIDCVMPVVGQGLHIFERSLQDYRDLWALVSVTLHKCLHITTVGLLSLDNCYQIVPL